MIDISYWFIWLFILGLIVTLAVLPFRVLISTRNKLFFLNASYQLIGMVVLFANAIISMTGAKVPDWMFWTATYSLSTLVINAVVFVFMTFVFQRTDLREVAEK